MENNSQKRRSKDKLDFHNIKLSCSLNEIIKKINRQENYLQCMYLTKDFIQNIERTLTSQNKKDNLILNDGQKI